MEFGAEVAECLMAAEKKMKKEKGGVPKGCIAVKVGVEGEEPVQRVVIPIHYLYHPLFMRLLEEAKEVYGFQASGPLRIPCAIDDFLHVRWLIEREKHHPNAFSC
ncbi:hypothetical protein AMTRI_Chr04g183650 [Amborella trichopoda]|uniref:Uncharacterized protein n=1 Tax=Amborella trichopoda TaxID=13333 RepID=W1NIU5_AMBTC|nr:hypothetical protein AMTR_s00008p00251850 [Amborella trichopoda]